MSKRSHHRNSTINVNELAEALTQRGWQPPRREMMPNNMPMNGGNNMNNSLSALSGLLGAVNGGNMPQGNMANGNIPQGNMMPGNMMPPQGMPPMPMQRSQHPSQPTEHDILKALFQQTIQTLKKDV